MENENYFNEKEVTEWLLQYQKTAKKEINEHGKEIVVWKDKELEKKITIEIEKIVKAIIQIYRYYIFEPYDDCLQHGIMSCFINYMKWTPEKGTAFNYFSIIAKKSLLNYTERKKKHRNYSDISKQVIHTYNFNDFDYFVEEMKKTLFNIINENFIGKKREKFLQITIVLVDYLLKTKKYISKSDFYSWAHSYGIKSVDIREFIKNFSDHLERLFYELDDLEKTTN